MDEEAFLEDKKSEEEDTEPQFTNAVHPSVGEYLNIRGLEKGKSRRERNYYAVVIPVPEDRSSKHFYVQFYDHPASETYTLAAREYEKFREQLKTTLKIRVQEINPHVVCSLCGGYFIDATTITECLHTFCKSCIVKYLMSCKHCPQCQLKVHETHPLFLLRPDRTLQDVVYKLIPNLFENEELRREEFNKSRGMAVDKKPGTKTEEPVTTKLSSIINNPDGHLYKNDEQICLCLERYRSQRIMYKGKIISLRPLDRKFLRCSIRVLVSHLKAMLYKKLLIPPDVQVEVICDREVLSDEVSMKQIFLMNWFGKETPMVLFYRFRETPDNSVT